jgi:hypothetical protein
MATRKSPGKKGGGTLVTLDSIERHIHLLRGHKVMLDSDLAVLYGVATKTLNRAVKRNLDRFPEDFMFRLTAEEAEHLRRQFGTSNLRYQNGTSSWGGSRYIPGAFTEHGAIMAASVLNSPRAVQASLMVVRVFVRMREMVTANQEMARKLGLLDRKLENHDVAIRNLVQAIRKLMAPPAPIRRRKIGF